MNLIKIAIAEDHHLVRQGMVALLNEDPNIDIIFDVENGKLLLEKLPSNVPDIILLDIEMPVMNGKEALIEIRKTYPAINVIIISAHYEDAYITEFIIKGAKGFLPKNCDIEKVVEAIYAVNTQGYYFDSKVSKSLVAKLVKSEQIAPVFNSTPLSDREIEILKLTCEERTNKEISDLLNISKRTVEGHRKKILEKTNSKNIAGLVMYAIKHNIIS